MNKVIALLASLLLFSTGLISAALPASAHADLVGSNPVDGSVLENAPESITLSFNSKILNATAELAVSNSSGELMTGIVAEIVQTNVTAVWPLELPGDTYTVAYRVVSDDGHPITGSFSFSYPTSGSETAAESEVAEPQVSMMETPAVETVSPDSGSDSGSTLVWVLGFLALALVVAGYFIWRRRST